MYRLKQFIILFLPTILLLLGIHFVKEYNKGDIVIHNTNQSVTTIKNQQYVIDTDDYIISLWPGEYTINIKKMGYQRFNKKVNLERGETIDIYPNLMFIPTLKKIDSNTPYIIPDEHKTKNRNNEIVYQDNQSKFAFKDLENKALHNLPNDIMFFVFSRDGSNAIIITGNEDAELVDYYYYSIETEELHILENEISLSGITWSKNNDKLSYIKPTSDKDSVLIIFDTETLEKTDITKLYGFHSAYSMFTLQDSHIIVLPIYDNKNLIDIDLNTERKKKLTFSDDIESMKTTEEGVFFVQEKNSIKQIKYLDLLQNGMYDLPSSITDINHVELLYGDIIYSHLDSSLFEEGFLSNKYVEDITRKAETAKDSFYMFDMKLQTEIFIKHLDSGQQIDKFLHTSDDKTELIFSTTNEEYYRLKLTK